MISIGVFLFFIALFLSFLGYTKIGCGITSFIILNFIRLIHILLCLFIILGPLLIKDKEFLILYIIFVSFIIVHWVLSSDICALTLLEQWITGKPSELTFIGRLVKPVYNVTNRHIMVVTVVLLLISVMRAMRMYKVL